MSHAQNNADDDCSMQCEGRRENSNGCNIALPMNLPLTPSLSPTGGEGAPATAGAGEGEEARARELRLGDGHDREVSGLIGSAEGAAGWRVKAPTGLTQKTVSEV